MSKIISVNAGSSSLKFQLFEMPNEDVLTSGVIERIGQDEGIFTMKVDGEKIVQKLAIKDHEVAVNLLLKALVEQGVVASLDEISAAGHRVVHGGEEFDRSVVANDKVEASVEALSELAPLHNPANLVGYRAFKAALPKVEHVFVFDTAFHQTMERGSYIYPLPYNYYEDYKIRRYGMHGTSHQYVSARCAELMEKPDSKIITCHLGNGASISAIDSGKCVMTSMGFTPLAGVMMGTRSGDIDPAILTYMMKKTGMGPVEMENVLNKESGMLGVSGLSSDARDIENAVREGNERAKLTHEVYVNRIINTIGGYFVQLGGLDSIIFTAGLGENDSLIRELVLKQLEKPLGIAVDYELNAKTRGKEVLLTKPESKIQAWIIPTDEEVMIARDTCRLLGL